MPDFVFKFGAMVTVDSLGTAKFGNPCGKELIHDHFSLLAGDGVRNRHPRERSLRISDPVSAILA